MGTEIPINPELLKWARETAGYALEELASKQGFSKFPEWEAGERYPTYPQLEQIAKKLHRPVAIFFFPSPPEEEPIEKSLRAISEEDVKNLSPGIRQLFRQAKAYQHSLRELWAEEREQQAQRISWLSDIATENVKELASRVRQILGISVEEQKLWKSSDAALKQWRNALAENGIYIFKEAFQNDRVAGFCIYDDLYPIVFINNSVGKNRQIFTVFHELAHLIYKDSYLDIFDARMWQLEIQQPSHIEVQCNAFAGEFLVPDSDLRSDIIEGEVGDKTLDELAESYHVSKDVVLRRFLTSNFIDTNEYQRRMTEWTERFQEREAEQKESQNKSDKSGNYYNSKMAYLGDAYLTLVLRNYSQGRISMEEAASHLDVKVKTFPVIEEKFLSRSVV